MKSFRKAIIYGIKKNKGIGDFRSVADKSDHGITFYD